MFCQLSRAEEVSGGASAVGDGDARGTSYGALFAVRGFTRLAASGLLVRAAAGMWQLALVLFVIDTLRSPVLAGLVDVLPAVTG